MKNMHYNKGIKFNKSKGHIGPVMQKILLAIYGGLSLSLTRNPRQAFRIIGAVKREWVKINQRSLYDAIRCLYQSRLISAKEKPDGTVEMILSEAGKKKALSYKIDEMKLPKPAKWDHLWRMVIFDIPEKNKKGRDAFSRTLGKLGFYKLQKSVFIYPYACQDELDFLIEFFNLRPYVRILVVKSIDNELHLKKALGLI